MYTANIYYLLDTVSETILGSFEAKSDAMARRILDTFDFDKAKLSRNDCMVVVYNPPISRLESFEEVNNSQFTKDCTYLLVQEVIDFGGKTNG